MARFKKNKQVHILEGDSAQKLSVVLGRLSHPALFWLDAHYSGGDTAKGENETPIQKELHDIFQNPLKDFVILIDDARLFVGQNGYPTLAQVKEFVSPYE